MRKFLAAFCITALICSHPAKADCVVGASMASSFNILDSSTIILIKTYCYCFYAGTNVTAFKDSFCSYESAVLYVGGTAVDAQDVKRL
jgi:hypothetical protein